MDQAPDRLSLPTPADIEAAAKAVGLSIAALCRRADLGSEIFYRWRKNEHSITARNLQKLLDALERERTNMRIKDIDGLPVIDEQRTKDL